MQGLTTNTTLLLEVSSPSTILAYTQYKTLIFLCIQLLACLSVSKDDHHDYDVSRHLYDGENEVPRKIYHNINLILVSTIMVFL